MGESLYPLTIGIKDYHREAANPLSEYQQWRMRIKQLLREAEYAKEKGQWNKAQDLLFEARKITRDFQLRRERR